MFRKTAQDIFFSTYTSAFFINVPLSSLIWKLSYRFTLSYQRTAAHISAWNILWIFIVHNLSFYDEIFQLFSENILLYLYVVLLDSIPGFAVGKILVEKDFVFYWTIKKYESNFTSLWLHVLSLCVHPSIVFWLQN